MVLASLKRKRWLNKFFMFCICASLSLPAHARRPSYPITASWYDARGMHADGKTGGSKKRAQGAAHPSIAFGKRLSVESIDGKRVVVTVTDRGPARSVRRRDPSRQLDLAATPAHRLGIGRRKGEMGLKRVRIKIL